MFVNHNSFFAASEREYATNTFESSGRKRCANNNYYLYHNVRTGNVRIRLELWIYSTTDHYVNFISESRLGGTRSYLREILRHR